MIGFLEFLAGKAYIGVEIVFQLGIRPILPEDVAPELICSSIRDRSGDSQVNLAEPKGNCAQLRVVIAVKWNYPQGLGLL